MPTWLEFEALAYLALMVTGVVCVAWYRAMERLGTERAGLFNGLIPVASLGAVPLVGAGSVTPMQLVGALAVLAGVILGLTRGRRRGGLRPGRGQRTADLSPAGVGRFGGTPENARGRRTADRRSYTAGIGERTR